MRTQLRVAALAACMIFMMVAPILAQAPMAPAPGAPGAAPAAPAAPAVVYSLDQSLVTVTVGDAAGFVNALGAVLQQVSPGMSADTLKMQIGTMTSGDPTMANMPTGSGFAIVIFEGQQCTFAEVAPNLLAQAVQNLNVSGKQAADVDGLLLTANSPAALATGKAIASDVKTRLLSKPATPDARVYIPLARLAAKYGPQMESGLQMMMNQAAQMQQPGKDMTTQLKIAEFEAQAALDILRQVEYAEVVFSAPINAIGIDTTFKALPGTDLMTYVNAPVSGSAADLAKKVPGEGGLRAVAVLNRDETIRFIQTVVNRAKTKATLTAEQSAMIDGIFVDSVKNIGNGMAIDAFTSGTEMVNGYSVMTGIADTNASLETLRKIMAPNGPANTMYKATVPGATISLMENIAQYKGVSINKIDFSIAPGTTPKNTDPSAALAESFMKAMGYKFAFVNGEAIQAMGDSPIEKMIDSAGTGFATAPAMASVQQLPPNGQAYVDLRIAPLAMMVGKAIEQASARPGAPGINPMAGMMSMMTGAPAIVAGVYQGNDSFATKAIVPAQTMASVMQVASSVMMMGMQQSMAPGAGGSAPSGAASPYMAPGAGGAVPQGSAPAPAPDPSKPQW
jgi:hypothetical protein